MINFENCDKFIFHSENKWWIPDIRPENINIRNIEWIPFDEAIETKNGKGKGVHFYIDDYRFIRVWNKPDKYMPILKRFDAVLSPDFSQYTDMPEAMRLYNHYRKHWLAAYWQLNGLRVIPTIGWSGPESYEYCFLGEPENAIISISSVGNLNDEETRTLFAAGCRKAIETLKPKEILWMGRVPLEFDWNVTRIEPRRKQIERRVKEKWVPVEEKAERVV